MKQLVVIEKLGVEGNTSGLVHALIPKNYQIDGSLCNDAINFLSGRFIVWLGLGPEPPG
jgi:hypothetical protein